MLLSYLRENDARLQWRLPWGIVRVDVTENVHRFPRICDSNMAVCLHCIRHI